MNRNKRLGKKMVMAAALAGGLVANGSPVAAGDFSTLNTDRAYYAEYRYRPNALNQKKADSTVTIDLANLTKGNYDGYNVVEDEKNPAYLVVELTGEGRGYTVTGSNIVEGVSKYRIVVKADIQLTLNGASITFDDGIVRTCVAGSAIGTAPVTIEENKKVDLILKGENILRCGAFSSDIGLGDGAELTVSKESTGTLKMFGREEIEADYHTDSYGSKWSGYKELGNQSVGIGKLPKLGGTSTKPELSYDTEPASIVKFEGGTVETENLLYDVATEKAYLRGTKLTLRDVEEAYYGKRSEENDINKYTQYTKLYGLNDREVTRQSIQFPVSESGNVVFLGGDDTYLKDFDFSKTAMENGKLKIEMPEGSEDGEMLFLSLNGIGYYGIVTANANTEMKVMDKMLDDVGIWQDGNTLKEESSVRHTAKALSYQWYSSDTKDGAYKTIKGAEQKSYDLPKNSKKYYKLEAEYLDQKNVRYQKIMSEPVFGEWKEIKPEPEKGNETAKKITVKKISKRKIKLSWKKKKGASGYRLYQSTNGRKYKKIKTVKGKKGSVTVTVAAGNNYRFKVKPYKKKKTYSFRKVKKTELKKTLVFTFGNVPKNQKFILQIKSGKAGSAYKRAKYKTVKRNLKTANGTIRYQMNGKKGYTYTAKLVQQ